MSRSGTTHSGGSTPSRLDSRVQRKSARLGGTVLSDDVLRASPKIPAKAQGPKRKAGKADEESRDVKKARLRAELAALEAGDPSEALEDEDVDEEMARELQEIEKAKLIEERVERARVEAEKGRKELVEMGYLEEDTTKEPVKKKYERKAKLSPPGDFDGDRADYQVWKRVTGKWREANEDVSDAQVGQLLLQALKGEARDTVVGVLDDENLGSYDAIRGVLEDAFGRDQLLLSVSAEDRLAGYKRGGASLSEFLTRYSAVRAAALRNGHKPSETTEGTALLRAAELSPEARAHLLQTLAMNGKKATYVEVKGCLRAMADSHELADGDEGRGEKPLTKKEKKVLVAYRAGKPSKPKGMGSGKGTGKHQQNQNKGAQEGKGPEWKQGDWKCGQCGDHQFASNTQCRMCGTPKPGGGTPPSGGQGKGKGKGVCWFFLKGTCQKGAECKWGHTKGKGDGKGPRGGGPKKGE